MTFEGWLALGVFATVVCSVAGLKPLFDSLRTKKNKTFSIPEEEVGAIISLHSQRLFRVIRKYPKMSDRKMYEHSCLSANAVLRDLRELQKEGQK